MEEEHMKPGDCTFTSQQLLLMPQRHTQWALSVCDMPYEYFDGCAGNALFVPAQRMPRSQASEYARFSGTRIDGFVPEFTALLWQFGRLWMGHIAERYALIAASVEEVHAAFHGDIFLVTSAQEIVSALPEDCNLHWRSFQQHNQNLEVLLAFLRQSEVCVQESPSNPSPLATLRKFGVPIRPIAERERCGRGDSLLFLEVDASGAIVARLATAFSIMHGIEDDD
jgi:hypothetical protein